MEEKRNKMHNRKEWKAMSNVASQVAAVEANIETYYNPLVNGLVDDVDATIEQFRAALESAGIQDVLDELERQKEEFIAAKAE